MAAHHTTEDNESHEHMSAMVWVEGATLMTPNVIAEQRADINFEMQTYRMPHASLDPDSPSRLIDHVDKW